MIKGVNKNIIEISDTGNAFFERAILFVRPASAASDSDSLRHRATEFLSGLKVRPGFIQKRSRVLLALAKFAFAAAAGAAVAAAVLLR